MTNLQIKSVVINFFLQYKYNLWYNFTRWFKLAYIRYKAITRYFNFFKSIELQNIPSYGKDYIGENEMILAVYNEGKDVSIITDKK